MVTVGGGRHGRGSARSEAQSGDDGGAGKGVMSEKVELALAHNSYNSLPYENSIHYGIFILVRTQFFPILFLVERLIKVAQLLSCFCSQTPPVRTFGDYPSIFFIKLLQKCTVRDGYWHQPSYMPLAEDIDVLEGLEGLRQRAGNKSDVSCIHSFPSHRIPPGMGPNLAPVALPVLPLVMQLPFPCGYSSDYPSRGGNAIDGCGVAIPKPMPLV